MIQEPKQLTPEQLAEHPLLVMMIVGMSFLVLAFLIGATVFWFWAGNRFWKGQPILRILPWKPRVWGLLDLLFVGATLVISQYVSLVLSRRAFGVKLGPQVTEDQLPLSAMALLGMANLATVVIAVMWITVRHQASLTQLGFGLAKAKYNCLIGIVAAVGTLPLIQILMIAVSLGMEAQYNHPLIKHMMENATLGAYLLGCFSAVIAAPLAEEFFFRVILQGWMQSLGQSWTRVHWFWGASEQDRALASGFALGADSKLTSEPVPFESTMNNSHADESDPIVATIMDDNSGSHFPMQAGVPLWPVFVSGLLFGLAHLNYGLSYIPLTVMGVVLGLLYRATQSIVPGLVVHVTLNAFNMFALGVAIAYQQAASP